MKNFNLLYGLGFFSLLGLLACNSSKSDKASETDSLNIEENEKVEVYSNPVLDRNFPDPAVIKAPDGYYYAYGTNSLVNDKVVNIQVVRSTDLINWEDVGDALPKKPSWADKDFWAPYIFYDTANQTYYLYYSAESKSDASGKCLGVATSQFPNGPFVDKGKPMLCGEGFINIDPMAFDDPASDKKLLYWGSGFGAIKVQELADDRMSFKAGSDPIELIHPIANEDPDNYQKLVEGVWVVYRQGYYYMFYSGDNCCGDQAHYAVMVARSKDALGPFQTLGEVTDKSNSVILAANERWVAPGHNAIITDEAGQDWIVYHAIDSKNRSKGRVMLIDKVTYQGGWPQVESGTPSLEKEKAPKKPSRFQKP